MKTVATLVILLVIALNANVGLKAQSNKYKNVTEYSLQSLNQGIQSDNQGLRKSAIYLAGIYRIDEAVETLTEQLSKEKVPGIKVLIALSLYNIGNPAGMEAVKELSRVDNDNEVKRMSTALYRQFIDIKE